MDDYLYTKNDERANKNAGWLEFKKRFLRDFLEIQSRLLWPVVMPSPKKYSTAKA
jgi:hypothetical protein